MSTNSENLCEFHRGIRQNYQVFYDKVVAMKTHIYNVTAANEEAESEDEVHMAVKTLLPDQQELIDKVFYRNIKLVDIAAQEGVSEAAIRNRLKKIYKKLKKILN